MEMRDTRANNAEDLKATWASITPQQCHRLIASMPHHIDAIIHAKEDNQVLRGIYHMVLGYTFRRPICSHFYHILIFKSTKIFTFLNWQYWNNFFTVFCFIEIYYTCKMLNPSLNSPHFCQSACYLIQVGVSLTECTFFPPQRQLKGLNHRPVCAHDSRPQRLFVVSPWPSFTSEIVHHGIPSNHCTASLSWILYKWAHCSTTSS